ncbi:2-oxoacid:ferredoxin oxidoreductase subunit gamma [Synergistales bacterium]|nr:2-oxoacid:ferredoxin oxidoreductase subunit gamma [Synergistales bacterium]
MERNIMVAGFGGQGVMVIGKLLSNAICDSTDKNVTFFPSYGAEQRGGTANCYVVISDEPVGSPASDIVDDLLIMNGPSLNKFLGKLKPGGTLFINSTIVKDAVSRDDITTVPAPVTEMALELGNPKVLNVIMLGVYIGYAGILSEELMLDTILGQLGKKAALLELNKTAFAKGLEIGRAAASVSGGRKIYGH